MEFCERSGACEYFIVDPDAKLIEKFMSGDGKYGRVGTYAGDAAFGIDTLALGL